MSLRQLVQGHTLRNSALADLSPKKIHGPDVKTLPSSHPAFLISPSLHIPQLLPQSSHHLTNLLGWVYSHTCTYILLFFYFKRKCFPLNLYHVPSLWFSSIRAVGLSLPQQLLTPTNTYLHPMVSCPLDLPVRKLVLFLMSCFIKVVTRLVCTCLFTIQKAPEEHSLAFLQSFLWQSSLHTQGEVHTHMYTNVVPADGCIFLLPGRRPSFTDQRS